MGDQVRIRDTLGEAEYPQLVRVWGSAVDATHDFLDADYRAEIERRLAPEFLPAVRLVVAADEGVPVGFAGTDAGKLEMLFIAASHRGLGIGARLLEHVIACHAVTAVDVNEQNGQALGFYLHKGFVVAGRSDTDSEGRPYPLLHLSLGS